MLLPNVLLQFMSLYSCVLRVSTAFMAAVWVKGTLHSVEKTLIQKAYCVYYHILKERRFFYVD